MSRTTTPSRAVDPTPSGGGGGSAPDVAAVAGQLRLTATRLARELRRHADAGLTPSQLSALATIAARGPITLGALAERERVAPPTVTRVVAKLEGLALVARQVDEVDRRVTRVSATLAGRRLLTSVRRRKTAWLASRLSTLQPDELARVADALAILDELVEPSR